MSWEVKTMRSKTSFFNPTVFWKNVTRFWPLWALYGVIWLVAVPLRGLNDLRNGWWERGLGVTRTDFHGELLNCVSGVGVALAVVFGILCAMALFSYLYQSRSACMIHALPIRREGLFFTNYLSGIAFFLVPNTVVALLTLLVELAAGDVSLWALGMWWLTLNGACLFFFSFAVFCAMFTGHILALPAFYVILNCLVVGVTSLGTEILRRSLFGFDGFSDWGLAEALTPVWGMASSMTWSSNRENSALVMDSPGALAAYVLAGLVLAALALVIYRRRQVESAGDVVSVNWVRPVFKFGVAFCSGLVFGLATWMVVGLSGMLSLWLCMLVWAVAGCFAAEMLLKKSLRVLKSGWKSAVAAALVVVFCYVGVELDLFGYESRVPSVDQVEFVTINGLNSMPYDKGSGVYLTLEEPEQIAKVLALHQAYVDQKDQENQGNTSAASDEDSSFLYLHVNYSLANGGSLRRSYELLVYEHEAEIPGTVASVALALLNDPEIIAQAYSLDQTEGFDAEIVTFTGPGNYSLSIENEQDAQRLWQAAQADFAAGRLGRRYLFDNEARWSGYYYNDLEFYLTQVKTDEDGMRYTDSWNLTVALTPTATETLAVLEDLGALDQVPLMTYGEWSAWDGDEGSITIPSTAPAATAQQIKG